MNNEFARSANTSAGERARMEPTRLSSIIGWILLPTVMFGGYSLLNLLVEGDVK